MVRTRVSLVLLSLGLLCCQSDQRDARGPREGGPTTVLAAPRADDDMRMVPVAEVHSSRQGSAQASPATPLMPGADAANDPLWKTPIGGVTLTQDPRLGTVATAGDKGVKLESKAAYPGGTRVVALVKFNPTEKVPSASADFYAGQREEADPADAAKKVARHLRMYVTASLPTQTVTAQIFQDAKTLHDLVALAKTTNWGPQNENNFAYDLVAYDRYLPGWPADFRSHVESDMAKLPRLGQKWVEVRMDLRPGQARFWLDDHAVAVKQDASIDPSGTITVHLTPGVQIAGFRLEPLPSTPGFLPIPLGGYANSNRFLGQAVRGDSLPAAGQVARLGGASGRGGVPFVFPGINTEGNDHIDVGRSYLRQANSYGYIPTQHVELARWPGGTKRDPARIQVRVPNGQYNALHLVAAADGDKAEVPVISAMFFRPGAGFAQNFEGRVPIARSAASKAGRVPVRLADGSEANLWHVTIPLDPGRLSSFADMDIVEIELTKEVRLYRSYPDPISYGYHQSGRPSSVHVFAATLERVPVGFEWEPDVFGHVWVAPDHAAYTAKLTNHTMSAQAGRLRVRTWSHDGTEKTVQDKSFTLPAAGESGGAPVDVKVAAPVKLYGYHDIEATLEIGGRTWTERRSFVRLAPDTRSAKWTEGRGALFGYWSYGGGHHTPKNEHHVRLMTWAGARTAIGYPKDVPDDVKALVDKHWSPTPAGAWEVSPQPWLGEPNPDPAKVKEFTDQVVKAYHTYRDPIPQDRRPDHVYHYPEPHISSRLTAGNVPAHGEEVKYTPDEEQRLKMFFGTSKAVAEATRRELPGVKIMIPWGDAGFAWPLLRAGFPKELIDGQGVDTPGFERIPERQLHEQSIHRLYWVKQEWEKYGKKPQLQYCEGIFVPTEPGAVSWREQMDIYNRWVLVTMAYGVDRFYSGHFAFDCTNYYGAEHYGGCGIQNKIPYCNPKPSYAAYATMTDKLNEANFDGWVPTGSLTTFCMRFKKPDDKGFVYAIWTLRGKRPVTLAFDGKAPVSIIDAMNNPVRLVSAGGPATASFVTDQSVIYVTTEAAAPLKAIALGDPDHSDNQPAKLSRTVGHLGDGSWQLTSKRDEVYENNHWGIAPAAGKFSAQVVTEDGRGPVLETKLEKQDRERPLMPWYTTLTARKPIVLEGAPARLGLWVKGNSDWGRVIYIVRDAAGERWISVGAKDDYNCDDPHSWSSFNFDGWRYLTFELPGHEGYDSFRRHGTTWWGSSGKAGSGAGPEADGVVDLPIALEEVIVEQRTHVIYVNDPQPAKGDTVRFGKLVVEYDRPEDDSREAIRLSKLRMPLPTDTPDLPNPIAEAQASGVGAPTKITKLTAPEHYYDGTRMHVHFDEVPGATQHLLWVSAHPDGRGAVNLVPTGVKTGQLVYGLRPGIKLYYWITYKDAQGQPSKPSPVLVEVTEDKFKEK